MSVFGILSLVLGLIGVLGSAGVGIGQAVANKKAVEETNKTNIKLAEMANQASVEQAELAYKRSLPFAQVQNLMQAGMSRQGALNTLTGGGSYTAPQINSASVQPEITDLSGISSAFERLGNIPSSVSQAQMISDQREALRVDTENKQKAELRAQEQHNFDMWQKMYGKNATLAIDELSNSIFQRSLDDNISLDDVDSVDKLQQKFNLKDDSNWRNMPSIAREKVLESLRLQAAENRANREQANRDADRIDRHTKVLDDLKNSEFSRSLSSIQQEKLTAEIESIWQDVDAKNDAKGAVMAENEAREMLAKVQRMADELNLHVTEDDLRTYLLHGNDNKVRTELRGFWRFVADVLPINTLFEAARILFK